MHTLALARVFSFVPEDPERPQSRLPALLTARFSPGLGVLSAPEFRIMFRSRVLWKLGVFLRAPSAFVRTRGQSLMSLSFGCPRFRPVL